MIWPPPCAARLRCRPRMPGPSRWLIRGRPAPERFVDARGKARTERLGSSCPVVAGRAAQRTRHAVHRPMRSAHRLTTRRSVEAVRAASITRSAATCVARVDRHRLSLRERGREPPVKVRIGTGAARDGFGPVAGDKLAPCIFGLAAPVIVAPAARRCAVWLPGDRGRISRTLRIAQHAKTRAEIAARHCSSTDANARRTRGSARGTNHRPQPNRHSRHPARHKPREPARTGSAPDRSDGCPDRIGCRRPHRPRHRVSSRVWVPGASARSGIRSAGPRPVGRLRSSACRVRKSASQRRFWNTVRGTPRARADAMRVSA